MKETHKIQPWYGFSEDQVFGEVMANSDFCRYVLRTVTGITEISEIFSPEKQKEIKDPSHKTQKDVRLDVSVEDHEHNLYDLEMQVKDKKDLGRRIRYYISKYDQRYTLNKGKTYRDMKNITIIFFCMFDPFKQGKIRYSFHWTEDSDQTIKLSAGIDIIIINAKGKPNGESNDLLGLVDLINDRLVHLNKYFDWAQKKIKELNDDPKWRDKIMDYETRLLEEKQEGKEEATITGLKKLITVLKNLSSPYDQILHQLELTYGDQFTKKELEDFIKQA